MGATLEATPVHDDGNSLRHSVLTERHGAWMLDVGETSRKEGPKKGNLETLAGYANNSTTQQLPRPQHSPKPPPSSSVSELSQRPDKPFRPKSRAWRRAKSEWLLATAHPGRGCFQVPALSNPSARAPTTSTHPAFLYIVETRKRGEHNLRESCLVIGRKAPLVFRAPSSRREAN
jgi:hypothetical protein